MEIDLGEIRKDVQCPIFLARNYKENKGCDGMLAPVLPRECIDKSMRLGNNECPACRKHCASRRSLRDDPNFDALIAALFTNIDSYEEELDIHLKLVSLNEKCIPNLPQPYLCCKPTLLVKHVREVSTSITQDDFDITHAKVPLFFEQFVALESHLKTEEIELFVIIRGGGEDKAIENLPVMTLASEAASKDEMQTLEDNETLSKLKADFISSHEQNLVASLTVSV
ncbi:unnamed protein product [Cochlearia groenlandica]